MMPRPASVVNDACPSTVMTPDRVTVTLLTAPPAATKSVPLTVCTMETSDVGCTISAPLTVSMLTGPFTLAALAISPERDSVPPGATSAGSVPRP